MTTRLVPDASVLLKLVLREDGSQEILRFIRQSANADFVAPEIVFSEVGNGLWKRVKTGEFTVERARDLYSQLQLDALLRVVSMAELILPSFEIAQKINHNALYDCCYLALALRETAQFITADKIFFERVVAAGYRKNIVFIDEL